MTKFTWQQCFEKANFLKQVYIFQNKTAIYENNARYYFGIYFCPV